MHPPNQDGDDVAGEHAVRDEGGGEEEQHPGQSQGGEADPTQEASGHLSVHGGESHACQRHGEQPLGVVALLLQEEVQEAVEEAGGGGQEEEQEEEAHRAEAFLQAAAEEQQSRGAEEELGGGPVVQGEGEESVEVPAVEHGGAHAEDVPLRHGETRPDTEQDKGGQHDGDNPAGRHRSHVTDQLTVLA